MGRTDPSAFLTEVALLLDPSDQVAEGAGAIATVLGRDASPLVGTSFADLLTEPDRETLADALERGRTAGLPTRLRGRLARPGVPGPVEIAVRPLVTGGRDAALVVVIRDLTNAPDIGMAARLLQRITELSNDTSDPSLAYIGALTDLCSGLGWEHGAVVEVTATDQDGLRVDAARTAVGDADAGAALLPDVGSVAEVDPIRTVLATGRAQLSSEHLEDQGPRLAAAEGAGWRSVLTLPVLTVDSVAAVLEMHTRSVVPGGQDVAELATEIGRQLGQVVERGQHLDRLAQVSSELRRSNEELERFAYIASHDLQEPLRKIIGFSELLEQRHAADLDDQARQYLGHVVDGARRLRTLITDLLAYSRVDRRPLEQVAVELGDVARQVVADLDPAIEEAGATVEVGELPRVLGDPQGLRELLLNLLSNSVKYHHPETRPMITIGNRGREEDRWVLSVRDDGIGIEPQYREQVFEVFRRLHGRTEFSGSGIGLAICRKIVEQHGGRIWIADDVEVGTEVRFTLPPLPEEER